MGYGFYIKIIGKKKMRSVMINDDSSTDKKKIPILIYGKLVFTIEMFIFSFVSLVFAILAYNSFESHHFAVKEYMRNWETLPLVDTQKSQIIALM